MDFFVDSAGPLLTALGTTIVMALVAGAGALVLGTLVAAARISPVPVLRGAAWAYTQFFVNVPLLALLILAVFALPDAGLIMPLAPTTVLVLALYEAAYVAEAVRSGVNTVGNGQIVASRALGLTLGQTLRLVVLPQGVRRVVPALVNDFVSMQKDVGLISILGVVDAISAANIAKAVSYNYTAFVIAGLLFILLSLPFVQLTNHLERRARAREQQGSVV